MALPVFDTATSAVASSSSAVTGTMGTSGSNRLLFAVAYHTGGGVTCTSLVRDPSGANEALTSVAAKTDPGSFQVSLWRLLDPPTPANDYRANFSAGAGNAVILLASYNGVGGTPLGTTVTDSGNSTNPAISGIPSASNELAIGVYETVNASGRTGDGNDRADDGAFPQLVLFFDKTGSASSSFSWPQTNSVVWASIGVSLKGLGDALGAGVLQEPLVGRGLGRRLYR